MDNNNPTFHELKASWRVSEDMIANVSKDDPAETARFLATVTCQGGVDLDETAQ